MVRIAWSWLVQTGVAMSSNILIPSANSEGESPSQVPGQTCGPCELVELATSREMDVCLSSLWLTLQCIIFPRQMATRGVWIPEFWVHISSPSVVLHLWSRPCTLRIYSSVRTKSYQMCDGASVTVASNSLLAEPFWSSHSGDRVRVSKFMAAYGSERLLTRDLTDRLHIVSLRVKICTVMRCTHFRQHHWNEQTRSSTARLYRL